MKVSFCSGHDFTPSKGIHRVVIQNCSESRWFSLDQLQVLVMAVKQENLPLCTFMD